MLRACEYILRTGCKRPCPIGDGCMVYAPAKGRKYSAWYKEVKP